MVNKSATGTEYVNAQLIELRDFIDHYAARIKGGGIKVMLYTFPEGITWNDYHIGSLIGTFGGDPYYFALGDFYYERYPKTRFYLTRCYKPNAYNAKLFIYVPDDPLVEGGCSGLVYGSGGWNWKVSYGFIKGRWRPISNVEPDESIPLSTELPTDHPEWTPPE